MFARRETFNQFIQMYPVISIIIAINTLLFLAIHIPFFPQNTIINQLIGFNLYIKEGQLWRLVTPIFLHSALTHFIFNNFALLIFGPAIESMLRPFRFILFYLLCGIGANIVTYLIKPLNYSHLGASGVIFGLLGFYLYIVFFKTQLLTKQDSQMIKAISAIAIIMSFLQPNVNIIAHFSGCLIGFILAKFFIKKTYYTFL
ncbi:rhomboid family intramembrane serine protease [Bacillus massiliigorillae]|uniref:rhomboid family intramembrane serine protease n=1 Tax=Bacillus massiliigorillae TaxID=1243664 RepID=UPI0003A1CC98|nr:rhomboid family intramembrane serine protease [Bacillus massiliigorillae]